MKAEPRSVMKRRSPRVVSIRRMPVRGVYGNLIARNAQVMRRQAITAKKIAVGAVQAIQAIGAVLLFAYTRPRAKPLAM